ncbi:pantetheine-phosphate adenylyltransferase [Streptococcus sp. X16XC17]|uniref:pantetheine-phosphate adenylyltransferase n=1 Tax=unclassified Streptococcus TaxID=2608887 RepID=UPI00066FEBAF|nr:MULTISPECIES: pantetheine-phosphate adenylyltransferase [unclassified Streptococcus]TCD46731.1 pantetheine-phosphate adenylyltransferase [Streptococcus sp. X16XC17]
MSDKIGLFTGSFDPITKGHVDLIERASRLFDQLYVGIFFNKEKQGFFSIDLRKKMVESALAHLENVTMIKSSNELAVSVAEKLSVTHMVRGLRNETDLAYEVNMEFFNRDLSHQLETIYLTAKPEHREISSSRVRELIYFKADIASYVPKSVYEEVKLREKKIKKSF